MATTETTEIVPLELEPGHFKTLIKRIENYVRDESAALVDYVCSKDFDTAFRIAVEIQEAEFWMGRFEDDMQEATGGTEAVLKQGDANEQA